MTQKSISQQLATLEAKRARLINRARQLETGQKIIVGGLMLELAKESPEIRKWLAQHLAERIKRPADVKRIAPLLEALS